MKITCRRLPEAAGGSSKKVTFLAGGCRRLPEAAGGSKMKTEKNKKLTKKHVFFLPSGGGSGGGGGGPWGLPAGEGLNPYPYP